MKSIGYGAICNIRKKQSAERAEANQYTSGHLFDTSRAWNIRVNVPGPDDVELLLVKVRGIITGNDTQWCLVSAVEVGMNTCIPGSFGNRHVHIALVFVNKVPGTTLVKKFGFKYPDYCKKWWMKKRTDKDGTFEGWDEYLRKKASKEDPNDEPLFEHGTMPALLCARDGPTKKEKAETMATERATEILELAADQRFEEIKKKYPAWYLSNFNKIQHLKRQVPIENKHFRHLYLYGSAGTGKTQFVHSFFNNIYNASIGSAYMQLYDKEFHEVIMFNDLSPTALLKVGGFDYLKTVTDPQGAAYNVKYAGGDVTSNLVIITSNLSMDQMFDVLNPVHPEAYREPIDRRFVIIEINRLLKLLGLRMKSKVELERMKVNGNTNPRLIWENLGECMDKVTEFVDFCYCKNNSFGELIGGTTGRAIRDAVPLKKMKLDHILNPEEKVEFPEYQVHEMEGNKVLPVITEVGPDDDLDPSKWECKIDNGIGF